MCGSWASQSSWRTTSAGLLDWWLDGEDSVERYVSSLRQTTTSPAVSVRIRNLCNHSRSLSLLWSTQFTVHPSSFCLCVCAYLDVCVRSIDNNRDDLILWTVAQLVSTESRTKLFSIDDVSLSKNVNSTLWPSSDRCCATMVVLVDVVQFSPFITHWVVRQDLDWMDGRVAFFYKFVRSNVRELPWQALARANPRL